MDRSHRTTSLFYLAHRTRDDAVAYLYINPLAWPRPSIGASHAFLDHFLPFSPACRHRLKLSSRPLQFSLQVLGLSFSPSRFRFPFGIANLGSQNYPHRTHTWTTSRRDVTPAFLASESEYDLSLRPARALWATQLAVLRRGPFYDTSKVSVRARRVQNFR